MIDIENAVFNEVATRLRAVFQGIYVKGEYVDAPSSFPAVTIYEADNSVLAKMSTKKIENAVEVMYEVDIFSNKVGAKKQECQDILNVIDDVMSSLNFTRTMSSPISNLVSATIFRQHARYKAVVAAEIVTDEYGVQDTVYRIYTN